MGCKRYDGCIICVLLQISWQLQTQIVMNRIFSVSLLGNKLYNYPNLANCDTSREESVDSGTSTAALR